VKIIEQATDRLAGAPETGARPVMVNDPKIGWRAKLARAGDAWGDHRITSEHIMGTSRWKR